MSVSSVVKSENKLPSIKEGLQNLRSTKRRTVVWPATFYVSIYEYKATLYDISLGGLRLKLPLPLANGAEAEVKIKNQVKLTVRVVWHSEEFIGLQFDDSIDEVREALGDLAAGLG